jgi:undecaprenyl-diphosphatase
MRSDRAEDPRSTFERARCTRTILAMFVRTFRSLLAWLGSHGEIVIAAALVVVAGTWGFVELLDEVKEGETQQFDEWMIRLLREHEGPSWLQEVGRDLTALGGVAVMAVVTAAVAGYLLLCKKYHAMWLVLVATGGGLLLSIALKHFIDRERPLLVEYKSMVYTSSFPSGHSMMAAVVYLTLGSLLARITPGRLLKLYFLALAMVLTALVGVSRVYLGVHWPTDVLAGWCGGLVWALLCWLVARYLQRKGAVEKDIDPAAPDVETANTPKESSG